MFLILGPREDSIAHYFERCDDDNDGFLTEAEILDDDCEQFESQADIAGVTLDDLVMIFEDADANGDKMISVDEISAELDKYPDQIISIPE